MAKGQETDDLIGSRISDADVRELRARVKGEVITPADTEYDRARAVFYGGIDRRPAVIVRVADKDDVARVITLARESGMELRSRSTQRAASRPPRPG